MKLVYNFHDQKIDFQYSLNVLSIKVKRYMRYIFQPFSYSFLLSARVQPHCSYIFFFIKVHSDYQGNKIKINNTEDLNTLIIV